MRPSRQATKLKRRRLKSKRRKRRSRNEFQFEALEERKVLAVPFAINDLDYTTDVNTTLTISVASQGVVDNDFEAEGASLTASKVDDPSNGTLTFNSNGTFTYVPDSSFEGVDTFTYTVSNGVEVSEVASVQVTVGDGLTGMLNGDKRDSSLLGDGVLRLDQPIGSGMSLSYSSDTLPVVLVPIETMLASGTSIPDSITANLTIDGVSSGNVTFNNTGLATGEPLRFVLRSLTTTSSTGMYDWSIDATLNYSGSTLDRTFSGEQAIVNRTSSEFGAGWWLSGLDRIYDQAGGALLVNGDGTTLWFEKNGSTYESAEGDLAGHTLVKNGGGDFTLADKWGDERNFNSDGYITDIQALNNIDAAYEFTYDVNDFLTKITDQFGREFTFTYDGNDKLSSINDFFGNDTSFTVTGGNLMDVTLTDEVVTGYTAPEWSYTYTTIGGQDLIEEVTDPAGNTTEYLYTLATRRLRQINNADHTTGNPSSWKLYPMIGQGFVTGAGNTMLKLADANARYVDELSSTFKFETDRFGNVTWFKDAVDAETTYEFNDQSLIYRATGADPDGGGSLSAPVTLFGYSDVGNRVYTEYADGTTTTAAYHSTLNLMTSFTNELGKSQSWSYFSDGDLDEFTNEDGSVWSYTWDSHGNMLTETTPDPDGFDMLYSAITTTYTYDATYHNRMTRVTWDNSDYQEYTYNSLDLVASFTDELGNTTSYTYDPLGQMTEMALPDPDGAGSQTAPVYSYSYTADFLLDTETDPLGNVTDNDYNSRGWLTEVTLPDPDGAGSLSSPEYTYTYDKVGNLLSETRPEFTSGSIDYTYNDIGLVTEISGPITNQDTTFSYDALGRTTSITDASGRVISYEYDVVDQLVKVIDHDPDGAGTQVGPTTEYDYAGQLISVTDPLGRETSYTYFDTGWLKTVTRPDPDGSGSETAPVTTYAYDKLGRNSTTTDAASRVTTNEYDIFGQITKFIDVDPDGDGMATGAETVYAYNDAGWLTSVTDSLSNVTSYSYDDLGRILSVTLPDPDGAGAQSSPVNSLTYDAAGNVLTATDARNHVTTYTYDDLHRRLTVTEEDPDATGPLSAPVWTYAYGANTLLTSVTDPESRVTSFGYDSAGRKTSITDPDSNTTTFTLDLLNRVTDITEPDPDGAGSLSAPVTSYTFDVYSRVSEVEDANNGTIDYEYDVAGQLIGLTDQSGNTTRWAYDALGRKAMETDELGYTESYYYNVLDRLIAKVDRQSRTTLFGFEGFDRQEIWMEHGAGVTPRAEVATTTEGTTGTDEVQTITLTDATTGTLRIAFEGEVTTPLDYNASAATVESALEALTGIDDVSVSLASGVYTVTFEGDQAETNVSPLQADVRLDSDGTEVGEIVRTYDELNRLVGIDDDFADYTYTLDNLGRVTETIEAIAGFGSSIYLDYAYDANGNRTSTKVEIGAGMFGNLDYENTYTFDNLDRLIQVTQTDQSGGNAVADKTAKYVYNAAGQVTYLNRYENTTGTGKHLRTKYTYEAGGRMATLQHRHADNETTSHALAEYTYTYDDLGQITSIDSTQDGVSDYTYDATGQLTDADHATGRTDEAYTYDSTGNRTGGDYVVSDKNRTDESTGYEYEYDRNGNRTKRLDTSDDSYELYEWDHRNRLVSVEFYNSSDTLLETIDYAYDAFNRMVRRTHDADGPGSNAATDQFFAGYDGIHATLEFDGSNGTDLTHRYLWGVGADQLLADEQVSSTSSDGDIFWTLGDQVGTIRDIAEWDSGASEFEIANHLEYDSFGNLISETDSSVDVSYGFTGKWTDPETGYTHHLNRWFDPVIGKWLSEDPIGFEAGDTNISRYVANRVTSMIDSNGLTLIEPESETAVETLQGTGENKVQDKTTIVISAFKPFNNRGVNASTDIANRVKKKLGRPDVVIEITDVFWDEPGKHIDNVQKTDSEIEMWIAIGEGTPGVINVETQGQNERGPFVDENKRRPGVKGVDTLNDPKKPKGDTVPLTAPTVLIKTIGDKLKGTKRLPVRPSKDAGKFICDEYCWEIGNEIKNGGIKNGHFIHIPPGFGQNDPNNNEVRDDKLVDAIVDYINDKFPKK